MENDREESASDALAMIAQARAAAADRLVTPWWYHPILGLLLAGYLVASLGNTVVRAVALVLFLAGIGLLVRAYRRLTGVWISGFEAGRASRWAYAVGGVAAVAIVASLVIAWTTTLVWPTLCIAVVVCVTVVVLGRRFDVALRAQLRDGT